MKLAHQEEFGLEVTVLMKNDQPRPFTEDEALALANQIADGIPIKKVVIWNGNRGEPFIDSARAADRIKFSAEPGPAT